MESGGVSILTGVQVSLIARTKRSGRCRKAPCRKTNWSRRGNSSWWSGANCATTWCRYAAEILDMMADGEDELRKYMAAKLLRPQQAGADAVLVILELLHKLDYPDLAGITEDLTLGFNMVGRVRPGPGWRRRDCPRMRCIDSTTATSRQSCRSRCPAPTPRSSSTNWCRRPSSEEFDHANPWRSPQNWFVWSHGTDTQGLTGMLSIGRVLPENMDATKQQHSHHILQITPRS